MGRWLLMFPLITSPHPALRQPAHPVGDRLEADPQRWAAMARALEHTMRRHNGVGIAAPQIAMRSRCCVLRDGTVLIDPEITDCSTDEHYSREGCLSLPAEEHIVKRADWVTYRYRDLDGAEHTRTAHGFDACVIQHELDHLAGVLLDERARELLDILAHTTTDHEEH